MVRRGGFWDLDAGEDDEVFDVGSFGEEVEGGDAGELVFFGFGEEANVAGLGGGVAGEVDEGFGGLVEESFDEFLVAAGAGRVEDDGLIGGDVVEGVFGLGEDGAGGGAAAVGFKFGEGGAVDFDEGEVVVAGDGEADGADASVEVEDVFGSDVFCDFLEGDGVDWEVDLEEAVGGVGVGVAEDLVGEVFEGGVGLFVFEEAAGDFAVLVGAEEERLVVSGFVVGAVEFVDDFSGGLEDFWAFEGGLGDGELAVGAAVVEGELDFLEVVVPVEGVFHFVAVVPFVIVGAGWFNGEAGKVDVSLGERFLDKVLFLGEFVGEVHDLPRGGGEEAGVLGCDAVGRGVVDFGSNSFEVVGFLFGDLVF